VGCNSQAPSSELGFQRGNGGKGVTGRVLIVGGGIAGLAAAAELLPSGVGVEILEARDRLGGRAGSFRMGNTWVDACQHVNLGCCSSLRELLLRFGLEKELIRQKTIWFCTKDGRVSPFAACPLPEPLHLAPAFLRAHWLSWKDKWGIARALDRLRRDPLPKVDRPLADWLRETGQTPGAIEGLWGPVVVSALNEPWQTASFLSAAKVFREGMLGPKGSFEIELPRASLGELFDDGLGRSLEEKGLIVHRGTRVRNLVVDKEKVLGVRTLDGEYLAADTVILAIPRHQWSQVFPPSVLDRHPDLEMGEKIDWAPISALHLWLDRPLTDLPHAALVGGEGHWLFRHRHIARFPGDRAHYHQILLSASGSALENGSEALLGRILLELGEYFPTMRKAELLEAKVVSERRATIRPTVGFDRMRPGPKTSLRGLLLAGDWTATGWPSTMEGATRSGWAAAQAILGTSPNR